MGEKGKKPTARRILIVDDDPNTSRAYGEILLAHGYAISMVDSGEGALKIIQKEGPPDLILMDVQLPGLNGVEAAREIAEQTAAWKAPIIMISGLQTFQMGKNLTGIPGVRQFLSKPCRPQTLLASVQTCLSS